MSKVIRSEDEYQDALDELNRLMALDPDIDSPEGEKLELLALLIEQYESRLYPAGTPDPIEAILFRMEQQGLTPQDLVAYLGDSAMIADVLERRKPLTLEMIRRLHTGLGLPADILIQEYSASPN